MMASGLASATATSGFTLACTNMDAQRRVQLFYGASGATATPWGGNSTLCVRAPLQRMPGQLSGGTAGTCNGAVSIDWLAYVANRPGAIGYPLTPGTLVHAQCMVRDPSAPAGAILSDAVSFVVGP
jgi:hypothetical protein